jgi:hypothetical protein
MSSLLNFIVFAARSGDDTLLEHRNADRIISDSIDGLDDGMDILDVSSFSGKGGWVSHPGGSKSWASI